MCRKFLSHSHLFLIAILLVLGTSALAEEVDQQAAEIVAETTPATTPEVAPAKTPQAVHVWISALS
jgi:hypothetical protein